MITSEMIEDFMSVNMNTADVGKLADIGTLEFDHTLPVQERVSYVLQKLKNPFCFRYGEMGIKLEFDEQAPPIAEVLADYLIRKKSGL